jgi:protein gp37
MFKSGFAPRWRPTVAETSIEWTDFTLNPGIYGCSKFGAGCDNCYAIGVAKGLEDKARGIAAKNPDAPPSPYAGVSDGTDWIGGVRVDPVEKAVARILAVPKARNGAPRRVFVTSMADFLHADVPFDWIVTCIEAMAGKPDHRWQVLTKRGQRWPDVVAAVVERLGFWPHNVWIGLSVAHQPDTRLIKHLASIRVPAKRFLSIEPLVGPVVLEPEHLAALDWIIVGGESGPNARPMHQEWVRSLRDQCQVAKVPFFFKQWGEWAPDPISGIGMIRVGKKRAGRILDGREWSEVPNG